MLTVRFTAAGSTISCGCMTAFLPFAISSIVGTICVSSPFSFKQSAKLILAGAQPGAAISPRERRSS